MIFPGFFNRNKEGKKSDGKTYSVHQWPDHVATLDEKTFDKFIQKYHLSVVDFWAPWCGPCKTMLPRLRRLSVIYKGKVAFGRLNTEKNKAISKKYRILGIPHLIFFSYGQKLTSVTGVKSVGDIKEIIDDFLKKI